MATALDIDDERKIRRMSLRYVQRLFRYWGRQPPAHELLAARYGLKDPGASRAPSAGDGFTAEDMAEIDRLSGRVGLA